MRKLTAITILMLSVLFFSCSKKDSTPENNLTGTSWKLKGAGTDYLLITITSKTVATMKIQSDGDVTNVPGTYIYSNPNVSFRFDDGTSGLDMTGKVNNNIMSLSFYVDGYKQDSDFIKQ